MPLKSYLVSCSYITSLQLWTRKHISSWFIFFIHEPHSILLNKMHPDLVASTVEVCLSYSPEGWGPRSRSRWGCSTGASLLGGPVDGCLPESPRGYPSVSYLAWSPLPIRTPSHPELGPTRMIFLPFGLCQDLVSKYSHMLSSWFRFPMSESEEDWVSL